MCRLPITYDLAELKTVTSSAENEEEVCPKLLVIDLLRFSLISNIIKIKFLLVVSIYCKKTGGENKENRRFWMKPLCTT